jgi:Fic family protein
MAVDFNLPVTPEILARVATIDAFNGAWSAQEPIPAERLERIEQAARIRATAASCRISGIPVSDGEVGEILAGQSISPGDQAEIRGYEALLAAGALEGDRLLSGQSIREFHAAMLGEPVASAWRDKPLHREAFDDDGKATGQLFATLPSRYVERQTDELATWVELELREKKQHPLLVVSAFMLVMISIAPFMRANGRLARALAYRMLLRAGYRALPYAGFEVEMEGWRVAYHQALVASQNGLWTESPNLEPWLLYFLETLDRQRECVEKKIALEREVRDYPPLQRAILETAREHGSVDAGLLLKATGANRNTLKDNLRRLVQEGILSKTGERRGTRYRIASAAGVER